FFFFFFFFFFFVYIVVVCIFFFFFFQAEDGIRDRDVTGVQTCALPILASVLPLQFLSSSAICCRFRYFPTGISCLPWQRRSSSGAACVFTVRPSQLLSTAAQI